MANIIARPTVGAYDAWADHVGDDSYRWDSILPFFKKTLTFTPPSVVDRAANASANFSLSSYDFPGGEVQVSFPNYAQPISSYGPAAFSAAGFSPLNDFASGVLSGYGYTAYTIDPATSTRSSAEVALLSPETANTALQIYQSCMARNIVFDDQKRAIGVNVTVNGIKPFMLSARREVIVSSGAVRTSADITANQGRNADFHSGTLHSCSWYLVSARRRLWLSSTSRSFPTFRVSARMSG